MNGIDGFYVRMLVHYTANRAEHIVHRLAEIFSAVCRDHDQAAIFSPFKLRMRVFLSHGGLQGIDGGISRHVDRCGILALFQKVVLLKLRGGEIIFCHNTNRLAVELLGIGAVNIIGAKSRLHVADGDLLIEAGKSRHERGGFLEEIIDATHPL